MCRTAQSRRSLRLVLFGCLAAVVALALPQVSWAHPLGNFTVNRYSRLELGSAQIALLYVVDMAEIPTFQEHGAMDADGDGQISDAEQQSNRRKSAVRSKVEHPFLTLKRIWGFAKVRYRGLAKNANRVYAMLALINVSKWGRALIGEVSPV